MNRILSYLAVVAVFFCVASAASAQLGQLSGGGTGGGGNAGGAAAPGSTTQGVGGLTTQGVGAATNAAPTFVGGFDGTNGIVGSALTTERNNVRQFQAITQNGVPVGGTFESNGTPRQVPVSLKIGFAYPTSSAHTQLMARSGPAIRRIAIARPEFRAVQVSVSAKGVAVLVGQVPTAASRRLAANLIRLRPGVYSIDNQVQVVKPTAAVPPASAVQPSALQPAMSVAPQTPQTPIPQAPIPQPITPR